MTLIVQTPDDTESRRLPPSRWGEDAEIEQHAYYGDKWQRRHGI
jgi:hypothetical protein